VRILIQRVHLRKKGLFSGRKGGVLEKKCRPQNQSPTIFFKRKLGRGGEFNTARLRLGGRKGGCNNSETAGPNKRTGGECYQLGRLTKGGVSQRKPQQRRVQKGAKMTFERFRGKEVFSCFLIERGNLGKRRTTGTQEAKTIVGKVIRALTFRPNRVCARGRRQRKTTARHQQIGRGGGLPRMRESKRKC